MQVVLILFWFLFPDPAFEGWDTLSKLKIDTQFDSNLNETFEVPIFSDDLLAFDGMEIKLEGYVIPLQSKPDQNYFVLSRFPYNSCFFCGNAGPETVAEVYTSEPIPFKDEKVKVRGILRLNSGNPLHLFYIIKEAQVEKMD